LKVKISGRRSTWSETRGTWFHGHQGEEFRVLAVHGGPEAIYEVDVRDLASRGEVRFTEAYVPAVYAEVVLTTSTRSEPSFAQ